MIVIVDYGCGNVASVLNMIGKAGGVAEISGEQEVVRAATKIILPGVGAFDHGMKQLHAAGLSDVIKERAESGATVLGICLGMQLLSNGSEEGALPGLGLINAHFRRFEPREGALRVPHMGWNVVHLEKENKFLISDGGEQRFYFAHSYHAVCENPHDILASTHYGTAFPSAYANENIVGMQFHPEKSHRFGLAVMKRFIEV